MSWIGVAIGGSALLGLGKSQFIDKPKEDRQRKLAAETIRYSPWTGMHPNAIQEADPIGNMLQFGSAGAGIATGIKDFQNDAALKKSITDLNNRSGSLPFSKRISAPSGWEGWTPASVAPPASTGAGQVTFIDSGGPLWNTSTPPSLPDGYSKGKNITSKPY